MKYILITFFTLLYIFFIGMGLYAEKIMKDDNHTGALVILTVVYAVIIGLFIVA